MFYRMSVASCMHTIVGSVVLCASIDAFVTNRTPNGLPAIPDLKGQQELAVGR